jgi:hypothetical protein
LGRDHDFLNSTPQTASSSVPSSPTKEESTPILENGSGIENENENAMVIDTDNDREKGKEDSEKQPRDVITSNPEKKDDKPLLRTKVSEINITKQKLLALAAGMDANGAPIKKGLPAKEISKMPKFSLAPWENKQNLGTKDPSRPITLSDLRKNSKENSPDPDDSQKGKISKIISLFESRQQLSIPETKRKNLSNSSSSININGGLSSPSSGEKLIEVPQISPMGGTVSRGQQVTISSGTGGNTISLHYTMDGTPPTCHSTKYDPNIKPIIVNNSLELKAIAFDNELHLESKIISATFIVH